MNKIFEICKDIPVLKSALSYIINNNTGNVNPYHSFEHISNVFLFSLEGSEYHSVPEKEKINLLIAALFHDFNHSGGKFKDNINIDNAKLGVEAWAKENDDSIIDLEQIFSLINITEFPYTVDSNSLNLQQQILRDSDMGSVFTDNWFQTIMLGLSSEANIEYKDFLEQQKNFMSNMKANSPWFHETKIPLLQSKLDDLNTFMEYAF